MRVRPAAAILAFLVLAGQAAAIDEVRYAAEVKDAEAEVRSGPGSNDSVYVTNRLPRSAIVHVVQELPDGWLKIKPPHGSFSFINTRFLDHIAGNNWVVVVSHADVRVPVFVGSNLKPNDRGTLQGCTLTYGTQVIALDGPRLIQDDESWQRIEPPPSEYRYIRETAVRKVDGIPPPTDGSRALVAKVGSDAPTGQTPANAVPPAAAADTVSPTELKRAAEKAEKEGRLAEAIARYNQYLDYGQRMGMMTAQEATMIRNRIANLQQSAAGPGPPATTVAAPGTPIQPRGIPQPPAPVAAVDAFPSSGPGYLSRSGRRIDSLVAYRLESTQGFPTLYVTPQAGVDLEPYVGRKVELTGPAVYRGDLRANYMTVVRLREVP
jgi:SH3-like domain-containing protein